MNDFTKEELQYIHEYINDYEGRGGNHKAHQILKKIQSMIDNYCEHD